MKRRIERWNSDNWSELIAEARYLQSTRKSRECIQAQIDWKVAFRRSMQKGDTKAAIKSLEDASGGSYLNPDEFIGSSTVRQLLESKHPEGDRVYVEGVMTCPHPNLLPFHPKCQLISRSNNDIARSIFAGSEILVSHLGAEVLGCPIGYGDYERKWVEHKLPLRYGGLGISLPDTRPELNLKYSIRLCSILSENIPVTQIKAKQQEKALEISKERDIDFQKQAYALKFHNEEAYHKMLFSSGRVSGSEIPSPP
ncbi:hypothetical protein GJ496_007124 [Pomphorhynchus laevis]|nr:hypothetical protein GJ496_007124 [Pomphorhynchus laevis]